MAGDAKKIIIEIRENSGSSSSSSKDKKKPEEELLGALKVALRPLKTLEKVIIGDSQSANFLYNNIKSLAVEATNYSISRSFRLTEDYLSQNTFNNIQTMLSKASGLAGNMIAGATIGSAIMPGAGTIVGLATGLATFIPSEIISGASNLSQHHSAINAATYQSEFSRQRAGLTDNGRGTEN